MTKAQSDQFDEYDRDAAEILEALDKFVTKQFGTRCPDFEENCPCCKMWSLRDQVKEMIIFEPDPAK